MGLNINGGVPKVITVNGTPVKTVQLNGVVIWTAITPWYAISNGVPQSGCNAWAWCGGYGEGQGTGNDNGVSYYGGWGHTNGTSASWGADTGNLDTKGCGTLSVSTHINNWSNGPTASLTVYGVNSSGASTTLYEDWQYSGSSTRTFNVSGYSYARVRINAGANENANAWMNTGLEEVRFY